MGAKDWQKHEKVRQRLADCVEEMQREERIRRMRDQWRKQVKKTTSSPAGKAVLG